jgi:hypothetical protein
MGEARWPFPRVLDIDSEVVPSGLASELEAYWNDIRRGRTMPARRDIDPTSLSKLLPNLFLIDVIGPATRFRWRLVGTKIVDVVGMEPTGKWVDQTDAVADDAFLRFCRIVVSERRPICHISRLHDLNGKVKPMMRSLLPLAEDGGPVTMLFGAIDYAPTQVMALHRGAA